MRLTVFLTILATAVAWKAAAPEPEPEPLITPGFAAVIILAHTLLTKSMMTMIWRGPGSKADRAGFPNWMGYKAELEKIPLYNIMCAVQLNEAEYAGPFAAALLFLEAKGAVAPIATATWLSSSSSGSLSTLNWRMPPASAVRISPSVLPTPENTIRAPGTPAACARAYSPPETTSMPAPSRASVRSEWAL